MNIKNTNTKGRCGWLALIMGMGLVSSLAGCANVSQALKSFFAKPYPVEISGAVPPSKNALYMTFTRESREDSISTTNEELAKQGLSAMFQRAGYQLKTDERSASVIAIVKLQAFGPDSESRTRQESRLLSCPSKGKECIYERVNVDSSYAICRYALTIAMNEVSKNATQPKQGLLIRTEWKTEQLERESDRRGGIETIPTDLASFFIRSLILPSAKKRCANEDKEFPEYLNMVERLLSRVDLPQGKQMVREVDGELQFSSDFGFR